MAIAEDAAGPSSGTTQGGAATSITVNHTPTGTPRGIIAKVPIRNNGTVNASSATYGGDDMTESTLSPLNKSSGEPGTVLSFHLGTSIPTGAQDCVITLDESVEADLIVYAVTAAEDTSEVDTDAISEDSVDDPRGSLALGGVACFACYAAACGNFSEGHTSALSGWSTDYENGYSGTVVLSYSYDTIGTADITTGHDSAAADDVVSLSIAIREDAAGGGGGRIMSSLVGAGGLAVKGGIAGLGGGLASISDDAPILRKAA